MRSVNLFVERDSNIPSLPALATAKPNSTRFPFAGLSSVIKGFLRAATAWWRSLPRESSSPTPRTATRRRPSPASCCGMEKAFDALRYWAIGVDRSISARAGESEGLCQRADHGIIGRISHRARYAVHSRLLLICDSSQDCYAQGGPHVEGETKATEHRDHPGPIRGSAHSGRGGGADDYGLLPSGDHGKGSAGAGAPRRDGIATGSESAAATTENPPSSSPKLNPPAPQKRSMAQGRGLLSSQSRTQFLSFGSGEPR